ncbi:MAG: pentapeptide repeat-containing protein [Ktedonobacterales bacterium]|nr:pentapeptide repeat-containing protein [Ktedonobacterales bacterium]
MTVPAIDLPIARQDELRALRLANEAAARPPYAWVKLTASELRWLIKEHGWVVDDAPGPRVDLRQANLAHADLQGVQLRQARLEGAVLFGADLRGADCFFAHFDQADLRETNWVGAQLTMARMRGARLAGADLHGAQLRQCWLPEADLSGANLDGADLSMAQMDHADLHEASLAGAILVEVKLPDSDLRAVKLPNADLRSAHLERAVLDACIATQANWEGAWCDDASLYGADLRCADLRGVRFVGAQLAGVQLAGARLGLIDLNGVDLTRIADLQQLLHQPTGDEVAAAALTDQVARSQAQFIAANGLLRLRAALAATQATDATALRSLRHRAWALQRRAAPRGTMGSLTANLSALFIGDGAAPVRLAGWAAALMGLVTALQILVGGMAFGTAGVLAVSGFTSAGIGYVATQTSGVLLAVSVIESLLGDVLLALFIAAVVRRGLD